MTEGEKVSGRFSGAEDQKSSASGPVPAGKAEASNLEKGLSWLREKDDQDVDPRIERIIGRLERKSPSLLSSLALERVWDKLEDLREEENIDEDSIDLYQARINEFGETYFPLEEPEVERIRDPETPEGWVAMIFEEIFSATEMGTSERRPFNRKEMYPEYQAVSRAIERIPDKLGTRHIELSRYLKGRFPEGVYLREKLRVVFESISKVHSRMIEVVESQGSLTGIGAIEKKPDLAQEILTPVTELRPIDFFLLTNLDQVFPETVESPETRPPVARAIEVWRGIGVRPYDRETGKLRKIKIGQKELDYTLKDFYQSDAVQREVRAEIAEFLAWGWTEKRQKGKRQERIDRKKVETERPELTAGFSKMGDWAEKVSYNLLTSTLTFDLWDREGWRMAGMQEVRDLMWFDWKRAKRILAKKKYGDRPNGPDDTVGCYWAFEGMEEAALAEFRKKDRKSQKVLDRIKSLLAQNKERAVFYYDHNTPSNGTLIGDFWTSTTFEDDQGVPRRLIDVPVGEIPWLGPKKFDELVYASYINYKLVVAAQLDANIRKLDWKTEELMYWPTWTSIAQLTQRLPQYCPWLVANVQGGKFGEKLAKDRLEELEAEREAAKYFAILKLRRHLARGALWTGSRLATAMPNILSPARFSREQVYGTLTERGMFHAMEQAGFLDEYNIALLKRETLRFGFLTSGPGGVLSLLLGRDPREQSRG